MREAGQSDSTPSSPSTQSCDRGADRRPPAWQEIHLLLLDDDTVVTMVGRASNPPAETGLVRFVLPSACPLVANWRYCGRKLQPVAV